MCLRRWTCATSPACCGWGRSTRSHMCCTWRRSHTWTVRSAGRVTLSKRTLWGRSICWRRVGRPGRREKGEVSGFRFHHVSTDEVYGSLGPTGYFTETTPYAPNSPYSASKASSDLLVRAYHHTYQLPTVVTNCSNNYGPYQFPEKLIPVAVQSCLARKPIPVYGDGMNVRDWLYVRDHARITNP